MNIKIVLDGKLKEPYFKSGVDEFKKRLTGYVNLKIVETKDIEEFVQNNTKETSYIVTLEIEGEMLSSNEFSQKIRAIESDGHYNEIVFLIGGSDGLTDDIKKMSNFAFSMSKLTFLHQEAVMILTEQIYRAFKILKNEPYSK